MTIDLLDPADSEFVEAISFCNLQSEGLGCEFAAEVKRAMGRIVQYPEAWAPLSKRTRRCRTNRFPYGPIYQIRNNTIPILGSQGSGQARYEKYIRQQQ
jgi:hypothetical protein